ncbi:uncharacterized protein LOC134180282 isoform X2 [Corticium candelabrum]|uniref:uncharacterized protein LOC134180282 isoform X2 n=1 Tax=Corticium candelabrum TaxID=121492 RepID=UPI002E26784D|nr:uncharacterized protein LOC134180282 isoform X2 [Corticium candelabrum]
MANVLLIFFFLATLRSLSSSTTTCSDLGLMSGGHPTVVTAKSHSGDSPQTSNIVWDKDGTLDTTLTSSVSCTEDGDNLVISSAGIPAHRVGKFPMQFDTIGSGHPNNPNTIQQQSYSWTIPRNPTKKASIPASVVDDFSALPMGPIGFALNGVPFFNLYNNMHEDAVNTNSSGYEVMDLCHGHPDQRGAYHYHYQRQTNGCLFGVSGAQINATTGKRSPKLGYAFDGIPVYGPIGEGDKRPTDLDACNGRYDTELQQYVYHTTKFKSPYIIGCYRYKPITSTVCRPLRPPCHLRCPNGLVVDSNGCDKCMCAVVQGTKAPTTKIASRPVCGPVCAIHCKYGNVPDANGCPTCKCRTATDRPTPTTYACPLYKCVPCQYGYAKDEHGCQTCQCLPHPCPAIDCVKPCPNGYADNENGCTTCQCLPGSDQPTSTAFVCALVYCSSFCHEYARDSYGCQTCDCFVEPTICPLYKCAACQYGYVTNDNGCQTCDCLSKPVCLYGGKMYTAGATFPSTDGCNQCTCDSSGTYACTELGCAPPACVYDGAQYTQYTFPAADGCNECNCDPNNGFVTCGTKLCKSKYVMGRVKFDVEFYTIVPADASDSYFRSSFQHQLGDRLKMSPAQIKVLEVWSGSFTIKFVVIGSDRSAIQQQLSALITKGQMAITYNKRNLIANSEDYEVKQVETTVGASVRDDDDSSSSNAAIIAGSVCGGLIVIVLIVIAIVWLMHQNKAAAMSGERYTKTSATYSHMDDKNEDPTISTAAYD